MIDSIQTQSKRILEEWLTECTRNKKISRNTVAIGIVVLHHLRKICPVVREDVLSQGGEITGARSGLGNILDSYGVPRNYLKEVTTRQGHQDGQRLFERLEWGTMFRELSDKQRDLVMLSLIDRLKTLAGDWLNRQNLKLNVDRRQSPGTWINILMEQVKGQSGGIVEQHLVGAKLARRFTGIVIPNHPAHAADKQTERVGDFVLSTLVYHVTAAPSRSVVAKCVQNIKAGLRPILLVPQEKQIHARFLAQEENTDKELTIIAIEDFIAINVIELATEENKDFFVILKEIVHIYNQRLAEVETDLSLHIDIL